MHSTLTGEPDPFGYWQARRYRHEVEERYRGSVLLVQGLVDWNVNPGLQYPWVSRFEEARGDGEARARPVGPLLP